MLLIKFLIAKFRQSIRYMQQEVLRLSIAKDDYNTSEHASSLDYPKHKQVMIFSDNPKAGAGFFVTGEPPKLPTYLR